MDEDRRSWVTQMGMRGGREALRREQEGGQGHGVGV